MGLLSKMAFTMRFDLAFIIIFQILLIVLYAFMADYDKAADASIHKSKPSEMNGDYAMFQDVHVMIFIGFGFLMTFLKRYGFSAVGFNLLLAALIVQWAIVCRGFFQMEAGKVRVSLKTLIGADVAAASVLISMGAVLGQTTFLQLIIMGIIEIIIFAANEYLLVDVFEITDVGGSIVVHTFGAYFGLAVSFMLRPKATETSSNELEGSSYTSDLFAMIGTLFLWVFWPSFNGGLVSGEEQYRAVINTYLSLAASTVTAFVISSLVSHERKFDMVHVQNSTLAGGVAVGAVANLMLHPFGALLVGMAAGTLSVLGYRYLTPRLTSALRLHDTCGVHNLHGMPGVLSGLIAAFLALLANESTYKDSLYTIFPAMKNNFDTIIAASGNGTAATGRSSGYQAAYQLLGLGVTLVVAIVTGALTGFFIRTPLVGSLTESQKYDDEHSWEIPPPASESSHADLRKHSNDTPKDLSHTNPSFEHDIQMDNY